MRISTWNLQQSLYTGGAVQDLRRVLSKYNAESNALQEIRWTGEVELKNKSIYYSCHPNDHELGVIFAARGKSRFSVSCKNSISDRRLYISLIYLYVITKRPDETEKGIFYDQHERTLDTIPTYDLKIVLGDFN